MKGWTTPVGVMWSSRSCATSENRSENVCARSSGEYRETGKPEQCVGPSLANVAITSAPPERNARRGQRRRSERVRLRIGDEVEDGTIVHTRRSADRVPKSARRDARSAPGPRRSPSLVRTCSSACSAMSSTVRSANPRASRRSTSERCPAADVHDGGRRPGRHRFDQPHGGGRFALVPAQLRTRISFVRAIPRVACSPTAHIARSEASLLVECRSGRYLPTCGCAFRSVGTASVASAVVVALIGCRGEQSGSGRAAGVARPGFCVLP